MLIHTGFDNAAWHPSRTKLLEPQQRKELHRTIQQAVVYCPTCQLDALHFSAFAMPNTSQLLVTTAAAAAAHTMQPTRKPARQLTPLVTTVLRT